MGNLMVAGLWPTKKEGEYEEMGLCLFIMVNEQYFNTWSLII